MEEEVGTYATKDVRSLIRSRDLWLGVSVAFIVLTITFASLFGWSFNNWKQDEACHDQHANAYGQAVNLSNADELNEFVNSAIVEYQGVRLANLDVEVNATDCQGKYHNALVNLGRSVSFKDEMSGRRLSLLKTMEEELDTYATKDVRSLIRSRDLWLGVSVAFIVLTITFASLFGWSFNNWKQDESCQAYYASTSILDLDLTDNLTRSIYEASVIKYEDGELVANPNYQADSSTCFGKHHQALVDAGQTPSTGRRLQQQNDASKGSDGKICSQDLAKIKKDSVELGKLLATIKDLNPLKNGKKLMGTVFDPERHESENTGSKAVGVIYSNGIELLVNDGKRILTTAGDKVGTLEQDFVGEVVKIKSRASTQVGVVIKKIKTR